MKRFLFLTLSLFTLTACAPTLPPAQPGPCEPFCLQSDAFPRQFSPDRPEEYGFVISGTGAALKDFETLHTKPMHVIVVRKDLQYFEHLHPDFNPATGRFTIKDLTFPAWGEYRLFANFAPKGQEATVAYEDIRVGNSYARQSLGSEETSKTFGDYVVGMEVQGLHVNPMTSLTFNISKKGQPVTLQEYLGALGHVVILREETLDFMHVHPVEDPKIPQGMATFQAHFAKPGRYKVFAEFKVEGQTFVADFVVTVPDAEAYNEMLEGHHGH